MPTPVRPVTISRDSPEGALADFTEGGLGLISDRASALSAELDISTDIAMSTFVCTLMKFAAAFMHAHHLGTRQQFIDGAATLYDAGVEEMASNFLTDDAPQPSQQHGVH